MTMHCLSQMVNDYMYVHHNGSANTIDPLYTSNSKQIKCCSTIPVLSNSDHLGLMAKVHLKRDALLKTKAQLVWRYSLADWD